MTRAVCKPLRPFSIHHFLSDTSTLLPCHIPTRRPAVPHTCHVGHPGAHGCLTRPHTRRSRPSPSPSHQIFPPSPPSPAKTNRPRRAAWRRPGSLAHRAATRRPPLLPRKPPHARDKIKRPARARAEPNFFLARIPTDAATVPPSRLASLSAAAATTTSSPAAGGVSPQPGVSCVWIAEGSGIGGHGGSREAVDEFGGHGWGLGRRRSRHRLCRLHGGEARRSLQGTGAHLPRRLLLSAGLGDS